MSAGKWPAGIARHYRFKQMVKKIPIVGPIIKDKYQIAKRNIKYFKNKDRVLDINHFV